MVINFAENVSLQVDITDQMRTDYADCQSYAEIVGPGKDCDSCSCSMNVDIFGQALCEIPAVSDEIRI